MIKPECGYIFKYFYNREANCGIENEEIEIQFSSDEIEIVVDKMICFLKARGFRNSSIGKYLQEELKYLETQHLNDEVEEKDELFAKPKKIPEYCELSNEKKRLYKNWINGLEAICGTDRWQEDLWEHLYNDTKKMIAELINE